MNDEMLKDLIQDFQTAIVNEAIAEAVEFKNQIIEILENEIKQNKISK